jgi:dolichol-phosphate mannosyltransferase
MNRDASGDGMANQTAAGRGTELAPELALIVPTFNERGNLRTLVGQIEAALGARRWELIFVDDSSPDGTAALARDLGREDPRIRCIHRIGRRGLAGACIEGFLATSAPVMAVMDADLQHDATLLGRMLDTLEQKNADLVIASRYSGGGSAEAGFSAFRGFASRLSTGIARFATNVSVTDPMSGFFMIRRAAFEPLAPGLASEGFKILFDILATARGSLKIAEVTYTFSARQDGASKFDTQNILDFLGLIVSKMTRGVVPVRFLSFALIGAAGILVHLVTLDVIKRSGASFGTAQAIATLVAMTSNFFLNNATTYRDRRLHGAKALQGLLVFYAICSVGAVSNIGVAHWLHYANDWRWIAAGFIGSLIGAIWNFSLSSQVMWRK